MLLSFFCSLTGDSGQKSKQSWNHIAQGLMLRKKIVSASNSLGQAWRPILSIHSYWFPRREPQFFLSPDKIATSFIPSCCLLRSLLMWSLCSRMMLSPCGWLTFSLECTKGWSLPMAKRFKRNKEKGGRREGREEREVKVGRRKEGKTVD